jgi:hypothetical protein
MFDDTYRARRRARPKHRWPKVLLLAVLVVAAFGVGLAVGMSLDDNPTPGGTVTTIRTLKPLAPVTTGP